MVSPSEQAEVSPSRQANRWRMMLSDSPDDLQLRSRIQAWRLASAENEAAWQKLERVYRVTGRMAPAHGGEWSDWLKDSRAREEGRNVHVLRPETPARSRTRPLKLWLAAGASLAVAAAVAFTAVPAALLRLQSDHITSTAEQRTIDLEDGSRVTLSAASAIAVTFSGAERRVSLLAGEALFQVTRDEARPFKVLSGDVRTTVLGTVFDVRQAGGEVIVDVQEGVVDVSVASAGNWPPAGERLHAGESISVDAARSVRRAAVAPALVGSWRQGQLLAQELTLGDAVNQLRRNFDGAIVLTGSTLAERRVTGAYSLSDPEAALRAIAQAHGAVVRRVTPWLLIISES